MTRPLTAKERTVPMPGVDLREQDYGAAPIVDLDGPRLRKLVMWTGGGAHYSTHLVRLTDEEPICGAARPSVDHHPLDRPRVCQACRAEASKLRAVVR